MYPARVWLFVNITMALHVPVSARLHSKIRAALGLQPVVDMLLVMLSDWRSLPLKDLLTTAANKQEDSMQALHNLPFSLPDKYFEERAQNLLADTRAATDTYVAIAQHVHMLASRIPRPTDYQRKMLWCVSFLLSSMLGKRPPILVAHALLAKMEHVSCLKVTNAYYCSFLSTTTWNCNYLLL